MKANRMLSYSVIVSAALLATAVFATNNVACASNETASAVNGVTPDLTVAAEKAVNSVVYIKVTQNAKTQTYDYYDPFEDFFGDIFGDMFHKGSQTGFKGGFGRRTGSSQRKGRDMTADIGVTFEEAAFGCSKRISFENGQSQSLEVKIPAGIADGQSIRLKGKGYAGSGGAQAGDLLLKVHVAEKPGYERKGMDVYTTENIPYTTAVLGGNVVFHTLYGDVQCKVPAGTQSGSKIRLKKKGIVSMKDSSVYGDAYVTIQIAVPKNLSALERQKLQELQKLEIH